MNNEEGHQLRIKHTGLPFKSNSNSNNNIIIVIIVEASTPL